MLSRENIDNKYKWNLSDIYANWESWEKDLENLKEIIKEIPTFETSITADEKKFIELIKLEEKIQKMIDKLYLYPYMLRDLDSKDVVAAEKMQIIEHIYSEYSVISSWIVPKILEIPKETVDKWIERNPELHEHRFGLSELYRLREHVLDKDKEKLLSYFSQYMGAVNDIYDELSISDIKWNEVQLSNGEKVQVTNAMYSKILEENKCQDDRRKAFEALYNSYFINRNTYAAIYRGQIQRDVAGMKAKNYKSTLERALESNNIPVDVYLNLIGSAKENSAPLKKYIELRKKYLGISEYHYYDNQIKIVDYKKEFTYENAKDIVLESVLPLGKEYQNNLSTAISEGWLDVFETPNKRSGAYSLNIYDVHPYMLLNFNGTLDSVFTLAHELGHTLHSMYSTKAQPYATHDYTIFVAEVASTFNEKLLLDHMLKISTDKNERIALIEEAIGNIVGTYYLQSLFANYEYEAYKLVENGTPITADTLDEIMDRLFKEYFGEELTMDELQKIIWARIPHFFNSPYYVYQYATSFSASSKLYDKITNEKYSEAERKESLEKYLNLLKSGGSDFPINQLKDAGVNLLEKENFEAVAMELSRLTELLENELNK
ncbi:oligoendopeptidase F [uncultured Fusobacterium sp.]|uniref:oligoendopeptidase F n=1 Tax=uncultured Fusobacterium sp. TaxID=159267 RepID=UPI0015A6B65F|nr:oligoendopeptidase F [uncultured Fusobacterium sp.]